MNTQIINRINELKVKQSATLKKLLVRYETANRFPETESTRDMKLATIAKVEKYISQELDLLESKIPNVNAVITSGESGLSDEQILKRAFQVKINADEIARIQTDANRRIAELLSKTERIESSIPQANRPQYNDVLMTLANPS